MPDVIMPRLSDSMEEGTIVSWLIGDGDEVTRGQEIVEIETDKATMPYEAEDDGILRIVAGEGETLPIGALIATIGDGTAPSAVDAAPGQDAAARNTPAHEVSTELAASETSAVTPSQAGDGAVRMKASPVARRIAREHGVNLEHLIGTGPSGRIVKADVLAAAEQAATSPNGHDAGTTIAGHSAAAPPPPSSEVAPPPVPRGTTPDTAKGAVSIEEPSRVQQLIARRMAEAKATIPDFTLSVDVDMDACVALRDELRTVASEGDIVPSFNDFVVKACAVVLRQHPRANGSYRDGAFALHERINVGVAVAAQDALVVPTIFEADRKSLGTIATEASALAERVRSGTVTPPELAGGTFTVSNLGMFGIDRFTAVINPSQTGILAVGAIVPRAVVRGGEIVVRRMMTVTLSADHRILYGADGAAFLRHVRELLEEPLRILVG